MKAHRLKSKVLAELWVMPIVQVACEKVGISRQTFYRWLKEDIIFKNQVDEALECSVGTINDAAESNIIRGIQNKDMKATMYWLDKRHPNFCSNRPTARSSGLTFDSRKHGHMMDMWFNKRPDEDDGDSSEYTENGITEEEIIISETVSQTGPEETEEFLAETQETP